MDLYKRKDSYDVKQLFYTSFRNLGGFIQGGGAHLKMPTLDEGSFDYIYHTPGRVQLSEEVSTTKAGVKHEYALSTFFPGHLPALSGQLSKMARDTYLVLVVFEDDSMGMLGSRDKGMRFSYSQSNSSKGADLKWSYSSGRSMQRVEWMKQFRITSSGMLQQAWGDSNQYVLGVDGMFSVIGPDSPNMFIEETTLKEL